MQKAFFITCELVRKDQEPFRRVALGTRCPEVPRYYFHIKRGRATVLDHVGFDLASLEEAAREAVRRGRATASADGLNRHHSNDLAIVVAHEQGTLFEVPVDSSTVLTSKEAQAVRGRPGPR